MQRILVAALAVFVALVATPAGLADTFKLPKTGAPALSIDVPTGWTASYDDLGNLVVIANDKSAVIELSMIDGPEAAQPPDEMAAAIIKAAQAVPYTAKQPGKAAGLSGDAYLSVLTVNNVALSVKVTLARIDASHVASVATLAQPTITPAQSALLQATLLLVKLAS